MQNLNNGVVTALAFDLEESRIHEGFCNPGREKSDD